MALEEQVDEHEADPARWGHSLANIGELLRGCLDAIEAKSVAEVGAYAGDLTRVLLDWAGGAGARVVAIEPAPQDRLVELSEQHPELELIREPSHDALRNLTLPDAVIIDGDHNYYTVSEELRLIDERSSDGEFPLLMLHDVGWPHGRRDAYWTPERVPAEHRQPLADPARLFPGEPGLADQGGLPMYSSAKREGGPRNGVLTAVEDFLDHREDLRLAVVPPFFGFGVVWRRDAPRAEALAEVVEPWDRNPVLERLEANRIYHLATSHARSVKLLGTRIQVKRLQEEKRKLERRLRKREEELKRLRKAESASR
jgi:Methyltransferase domain